MAFQKMFDVVDLGGVVEVDWGLGKFVGLEPRFKFWDRHGTKIIKKPFPVLLGNGFCGLVLWASGLVFPWCFWKGEPLVVCDVLPPLPEFPRSHAEGAVEGQVGVVRVLLFEAFPSDLAYGKVERSPGLFGIGEGAVTVFIAVPGEQEILGGRGIGYYDDRC